jgi:hypothetical protein
MKMCKVAFAFLVILSSSSAFAQSETDKNTISIGGENVKEYGEFLIDLDLFAISQPKLPKYDFSVSAMMKDYNKMFSLDNSVIYSHTTSAMSSTLYSFQHDLTVPIHTMNSATFKLGNGQLTTYGDYRTDGSRNHYNGVPWGKNDFRGGAEFKFDNGFRFGVEVQYQKKNGLIHNGPFVPRW